MNEFVNRLRDYGGTPQEILESEALLELFVPTLRADFGIVEQYRSASDRYRLTVPTTVFGGKDDHIVAVDDLLAWDRMTNLVNTELLEGGHFFLREHLHSVIQQIERVVQNAPDLASNG